MNQHVPANLHEQSTGPLRANVVIQRRIMARECWCPQFPRNYIAALSITVTIISTLLTGAYQKAMAQSTSDNSGSEKLIEDRNEVVGRMIWNELKTEGKTKFYDDSAVMIVCGKKDLADRLMIAPNKEIAILFAKHTVNLDTSQMRSIDQDVIIKDVMGRAYGYRDGYIEAFLNIHLETPTGDEGVICEKTAFMAGQLLSE